MPGTPETMLDKIPMVEENRNHGHLLKMKKQKHVTK